MNPGTEVVMGRTLALAGLLLAVAGCSSTLVVLVPDPGGKVGQVAVTTDGGQQVLTQSGQSTKVSGAGRAPGAPKTLRQDTIQDLFAVALRNEPAPPLSYLLYFDFDTVTLRPESQRRLPEVLRAIQGRKSCDLSVIGHTDRIGEADFNYRLSLRRAEKVRGVLMTRGVAEGCIVVRYYGESDPLIPTPDEVAEPRNRRVEVQIR